jgi:hypothetical protein
MFTAGRIGVDFGIWLTIQTYPRLLDDAGAQAAFPGRHAVRSGVLGGVVQEVDEDLLQAIQAGHTGDPLCGRQTACWRPHPLIRWASSWVILATAIAKFKTLQIKKFRHEILL